MQIRLTWKEFGTLFRNCRQMSLYDSEFYERLSAHLSSKEFQTVCEYNERASRVRGACFVQIVPSNTVEGPRVIP
jgi:hypothetical protein